MKELRVLSVNDSYLATVSGRVIPVPEEWNGGSAEVPESMSINGPQERRKVQ